LPELVELPEIVELIGLVEFLVLIVECPVKRAAIVRRLKIFISS
jgi:hypothetical protein